MRVLKIVAIALAFLVFTRYFPVVYYASEFNDFVKAEVQRTRIGPQLR